MGERSNIVFKFDTDKEVCLYSHWKGSQLANVLQEALKRRERWSDPSYLCRIVFCEMVKGDFMGSTGYGISPYIIDNDNYLPVYVDCDYHTVTIGKHTWQFEYYLLVENPSQYME